MNQSAAEIEGKRIYSITFWSSELVLGRMKDQRVREFLYLNTKKRVLINRENDSNVYFHRFIFLKVQFIASFSGKGKEFIDDGDLDEKEDIGFYRKIDKKFMLTGDETLIPILKRRVGRMRIESDSSSREYKEEEEQIGIPNCNAEDSDEHEQMIPEGMLPVYGTDKYEWNHYEKPKGDVCEFREDSSYLSSFLYSLYKPTKNNADIKKIFPMAKNYVGEVTPATAKILNDPFKDEMTVVRLSRQRMTFI